MAVLLGLGTWQLQRLDWKRMLIAERASRLEAPPIALPDPVERPEDLEFRRVELSGRFLNDWEFHQGGRTYKQTVGYHVVTPLRLDDGRTILVDRGWVPPLSLPQAERPDSLVEGPVTLQAVLRSGGWKGRMLFQPDNDPEGNYWIWPDLPAMAEHAGLARPVTELYAVALPDADRDPDSKTLPIPEPSRVEIRNDHLQYALTWYALAGALLVIYVMVGLRREKTGETR